MILANLVGEDWCYIVALVWISFTVSEAEHLKTLSFKQQLFKCLLYSQSFQYGGDKDPGYIITLKYEICVIS